LLQLLCTGEESLVIGDTEQIAPIWNSLPCIDIGNMVEENILPEGSQEELTEAYAWCVTQERALHLAAL
jgi:hypothetical protein